MSIMVDSGGKVTASPKTGRILGKAPSATQQKTPVDNVNELAKTVSRSLQDVVSSSNDIIPARRAAVPNSILPKTSSATNASAGLMSSKKLPNTGQTSLNDDKSDNDVVSAYEKYFLENGMTQEDLDKINDRGSWLDVHMNNPTTAAVTDDFSGFTWTNPFLETNMDEFKEGSDRLMKSIAETGDLPDNKMPEKYESDNNTSIGNFYVVDDGKTMDYDHVTANKALGEAMQKYSEMGMGGRGWWEYSPGSIYMKSDEMNDYGFKPYTPDETSAFNITLTDFLDAPGDITGALAGSRPFLNDVLGNGYKINFDQDGDKSTTDDILKIDGTDWDYRARPYVDNMTRLLKFSPETFVNMPENGMVHGAPVSTLVQEYEMTDADGTTKYLHGSVDDEKSGWVPDGNGDYLYRLAFTDGQTIDMPDVEEGQSLSIPAPSYVPIDKAQGTLPENVDSLNDTVRENGYESIYEAPVLYVPDLVMDDGTRLNWDQVQQIYTDRDVKDNPDSDLDDRVSYDTNIFNKPRRLTGEVASGNWGIGDLPADIWDYTMGSIPVMTRFAWPLSIASAASNSLAGVDPGSYDPLTSSSQYISGDYDENGHMTPTYSDTQQAINFAGNSLVPLTEQIAGPLSGHSAVEFLSGKYHPGSNTRQVLRDFGLGMAGEGAEEVIGNFFDELTNQGLSAYGAPTDENGKRLLDENGEPVRDENGEYKYVDVYGNPMEYMTDETGHIYRDQNTPLEERVRNMLNPEDALNAMYGGALIDAAMQLIPNPLTPREGMLIPQLRDARNRDRIRSNLGLSPYREVEREDTEFEQIPSEVLKEGV